MAAQGPVLIAGGGIRGLALAISLAKRGRQSIVLERRAGLAAEGAGIQLGPNAVRALRHLGVADVLEPLVGEPQHIAVHDGSSARVLARLPLGDWLAARHGAPYWVAHRRDLHGALLATARGHPGVQIRPGSEIVTATQTSEGVEATSAFGERIAGALLIGADGVWSSVRRLVAPGTEPHFVGATATRTVIPAGAAGALDMPAVGLWLTPGVHVVHYPVRRGADIAVVIIAAEDWHAREWDGEADPGLLRTHIAGFHPRLADVLAQAGPWRKWALQRLPRLPAWRAGRIGLIGDAAHPMLPYLAQGGAMALEDAVVLGACLAHCASDDAAALAGYESMRRDRAARVQALSERNGRIYHMHPPLSWARDVTLRMLPGTRLMAAFDWLYGWRAD